MGRRKLLAGITRQGLDISFKYNDNGIRTEKRVNGISTRYHLIDDRVTFETNGADKIYYSYDSENKLVSMNLNGVEYYYVRNVQDDIIGLLDDSGNLVVTYVYDSWGKLVSINGTFKDTVGVKNQYRYRGYRYDNETGLYYLQSRYYNPEWGRFINADSTYMLDIYNELLNNNLLAYCSNNPTNNYDPSGFNSIKNIWDNAKRIVSSAATATKEFLRSKKFIAALINTVLSSIVGGIIGGGIVAALKRRAASYGRQVASTYLSNALRIQLRKTSISLARQATIIGGVIKIFDVVGDIINPGDWLFDRYLDKNHDGLLD